MNIQLPTGSMMPQARPSTHNVYTSTHSRQHSRQLPPNHLDMGNNRSTMFEEDVDDFQTPRALADLPISPSATLCFKRQTQASDRTFFQEDNEGTWSSDQSGEIVPFKLSQSIRRNMKSPVTHHFNRPTSIVIPSPSLWPRMGKGSQPIDIVLDAASPMRTPLSPSALAQLDASSLRRPFFHRHTTPSLTDGSTATDPRSNMSCPPTPSLGSIVGDDDDLWGCKDTPASPMSCELPNEAMELLLRLSPDPIQHVICPMPEMVMYTKSDFADNGGLNIILTDATSSHGHVDEFEERLSPISVPSPGIFFASLRHGSAEVWSMPETSAENESGTAATEPSNSAVVTANLPVTSKDGMEPVTARRLTFDLEELEELLGLEGATDEPEGDPFEDEYKQKISQTAFESVDRTNAWIKQQERLMESLRNATPSSSHTRTASAQSVGLLAPKTPITPRIHRRSMSEPNALARSNNSTPSKKSVRFADETTASPISTAEPASPSPQHPQSDSTLYHAFQTLLAQANPRDAYIHRASRAEALRMQRRHRLRTYRQQLLGSFDLNDPPIKKSDEPRWSPRQRQCTEEEVSQAAAQRAALAGTFKQRRALEQLNLQNWMLQVQRFLSGGSLLPAAVDQHITTLTKEGIQPRILDFGSRPLASSGWALAVEHRNARVWTVPPPSPHHGASGSNAAQLQGLKKEWLTHRGPSNHHIVTSTKLWNLPFPSGFFHVITARSLHMLLHTRPAHSEGSDEWHLTLKELRRVLAPNGLLHIETLDAELVSPPSQSTSTVSPSTAPATTTALKPASTELAVALKSAGYDAYPSARMASRFRQVRGWTDVRQSIVHLPVLDPIAGLLGGVMWERWLMKFSEEGSGAARRLLTDTARLFDVKSKSHGASGGALRGLEAMGMMEKGDAGVGLCWRLCVGVARKA